MSELGQFTVETPESVEVTFDLAGPGSRFCGMVIDTMLIWLFVVGLVLVANWMDAGWVRSIEEGLEEPFDSWVFAIVILAIMLLLFGYYAAFELWLNGQTPGKRYLKIRVIRDDGTPATALDIVIRNVLRIVDTLPSFYAIGGVCSLLHPQHKRLGDLAAGTIVVKESVPDFRANSDRRRTLPDPVDAPVTYGALSLEEQRIIRGFLQRRIELLPDARARLAWDLADRLHARHGGSLTDPEWYLERLAEGRHHDT